jgi:hypothetical protein
MWFCESMFKREAREKLRSQQGLDLPGEKVVTKNIVISQSMDVFCLS